MPKDRFLARGVIRARRPPGKRPRTSQSDSESDAGDVENLEHQYGSDPDDASSADEFLETPAEKRLRLAKDYIGRVQQQQQAAAGDYDAEQIDRDLIAERLATDVQERAGRWSRRIAAHFAYAIDEALATRVLRGGHVLPPTCVAITPDARFVYSGGKDGALVKWHRESGRRLAVFRSARKKRPDHDAGHCDEILAVAVSSDGRYVATGGRDRRIHIWSVAEDRHLGVFHQHKDAVTGLAFRRGTNHLYSCSLDRMVKLWNIDDLGYMDTLFGHQDSIAAIAALQREQAVTVGCRDKTVRMWKIADDSQLVFRGGAATDQHRITKSLAAPDADPELAERNPRVRASIAAHHDELRALAAADAADFTEQCIDCVAMIDEECFVTGSDSGAICLWSVQKKKPVFIHHLAHGVFPSPTDAAEQQQPPIPPRPFWISALCAVPLTDLFLSASSDGAIRLWRMRSGKIPGFDLVNLIAVKGFVNGLSVCELPSDELLSLKRDIVVAAAVGQEPRLGRWNKMSARNVIKLYTLKALPQKSLQ
ncbi:pre-rRNA processing protein [Coemansia sp. RSA 2611]|nr:pre-rRNA processing protein [Coemansia sp. RSA 2611]